MNSTQTNTQPKKNYLIQEQRDENRISFWVDENTTKQEAKASVSMAWHNTWVVGEISDDDYKQFLQLCEIHNKDKSDKSLYMFCDKKIDDFLKRCELKSQANSLKSKLAEVQARLDAVEEEIKNT